MQVFTAMLCPQFIAKSGISLMEHNSRDQSRLIPKKQTSVVTLSMLTILSLPIPFIPTMFPFTTKVAHRKIVICI